MPALVPVDYDPFFDVAQHDPNALVRLGPGGVTPAAAPNALQGALEAAYGLTGVPDLQAAYAAAARGEPLPALGQGAAGAAALIPALKPLALAPMAAMGIRAASKIPTGPIANALSRSENALLPAGGEVNRAVNALTGSPMADVTLFHGTSPEAAEAIRQSGRINGPAFFTTRKSVAADYAGGGPVLSVKVPEDKVKIDLDLPGGQLLSVPEANKYLDKDNWNLHDYLSNGFSVGTENSVPFGTAPIRAYHGSPYDFDAFDASKIGTGQGAQTYGYGLYTAQAEPVAESYLGPAAKWKYGTANAQTIYDRLNNQSLERGLDNEGWEKLNAQRGFWEKVVLGRSPRSIIEDARINPDEYGDAELAFINSLNPDRFKRLGGHMYEVNINAHPDTFLHWDKPLSEQPEAVKQALESTEYPYHAERLVGSNWMEKLTGSDLINKLAGVHASASEALRAAGINGIKYLDQGSRNAITLTNKAGNITTETNFSSRKEVEDYIRDILQKDINDPSLTLKENPQTHNYVVFDPKIIEIIKKYGLAPLIAGGAFATGGDANAATHLVPVDHDPFKTEEP